MRIALLSPLYESVPPRFYGGTERVVDHLCRGLSKAGFDVTLFASGDSRVPGRLIPITDRALRQAGVSIAASYPFHLQMLADVAGRADEFDVIHNHHDLWMLPLSELTSTPIVSTLHGRIDVPGFRDACLSYPHASFVSISDSQRKPIPELDWRATIHHGIDCRDFDFYPNAGNYLAFLGRITSDKRPEWAIRIAKEAGIPLKIAAKIEGPDGQAYYDTLVKPHVDGKNVEFLGEISEKEKPRFLGEALGLVFPIDWPEPFGLVMIESLACGTPVLARPCGSVLEILSEGVTGFVDSDLGQLAEKAHRLVEIDRKRCRRWVEERFSLERMTEEYIHVYRALTQGFIRGNRRRRDFLSAV